MSVLRGAGSPQTMVISVIAATLMIALDPRHGSAQAAQGAVTQLDPLTVEAVYTGDTFLPVRGGLRQRAVYLDNLDLRLRLRGGPLVGLPGTSAFVYLISNRGTNPSTHVGDAQGVSNIAAEGSWRLYEAWVQQNFHRDGLSMLVGLYDLNTEFDVIESAGLFLNSSFGIGPDFSQSGRNGPSIFPVTSLALRVKFRPIPEFYVAASVLDGVPGDPENPSGVHVSLSRRDGALIAAEAALLQGTRQPTSRRHSRGRTRQRHIGRGDADVTYDGKLAMGFWVYTSRAPRLDAPGNAVSVGGYVLGERAVYHEPGGGGRLSIFGRLGLASSSVNRFGSYFGAGTTYTGLLPGRPEDEAGAAIAVARNGAPFKRAILADGRDVVPAESVVELTYRVQLIPGLALQPGVQWVMSPDTSPSVPNALVLALRGEGAIELP